MSYQSEQPLCSVTNESDMSGVEIVSRPVSAECPCNISGIGNICTSWVGQKGIGDIKKKIEDEQEESEVKAKSRELRVLATECLKAFESAGLQSSEICQVRKAMDLCHSYAPRSSCTKPATSTIASLWKRQPLENEMSEQTTQSLAASVLGEKLVSTVTEEKQQPPDVSGCICISALSAFHFITTSWKGPIRHNYAQCVASSLSF